MLGALFATNMGHTRPWGWEGWRLAFVAGALPPPALCSCRRGAALQAAPLQLAALNSLPLPLLPRLPAVGCTSLLIGLLNLLFAVDPRYKLEDPQYRWGPGWRYRGLADSPGWPRCRLACKVGS